MHVLVTADAVGGVWTYTRELVTGLAQRGIRVTLVSFGEIPRPNQMDWLTGLRTVDFYPTAFRLEWMHDAEEDISASSEYLLRLIGEKKPDLLHSSQFAYGALDLDIPKVVVAHSDVLSWWTAVHGCEPDSSPWIDLYRETVSRGLDRADIVITPTRWMLAALTAHYGKVRAARVIYNGANPGLLNPHMQKEDLILGVGRVWDQGKQLRLLEGGGFSWPVVIAGSDEGPDGSSRRPGKPDPRVSFRGHLSDGELRQLYARTALLVGPSRYEPFGLAPLEAAFSRCALVLNDIPPFRELWGESACYFSTNDPQSLRETVNRLCEDRLLRVTYANLAYRRANSFFTAHRMVEQYCDLYKSLVPEKVIAA